MYNIPFTGNLTSDLELIENKKTGVKRVNFRLGINQRGKDGEEVTKFLPFTAFGTLAENLVKSVRKGTRLNVVARVDTYEKEVQIDDKDVNLGMVGFNVVNAGPDLTWASASVEKNPRTGGGSSKSSFNNDDDDDETEEVKPAKKATAKASSKPKAAVADEDDDDDF